MHRLVARLPRGGEEEPRALSGSLEPEPVVLGPSVTSRRRRSPGPIGTGLPRRTNPGGGCPSAIGPPRPRRALTRAGDWYVLAVTHAWLGLAVVLLAFGCGEGSPPSSAEPGIPVLDSGVSSGPPTTPTSEPQGSPPAPVTRTSESQASPPPAPESARADPAPPVEPSRELEVVARLVEPKSTAGCGVLHIVVVMRYEIIDVVEGTYGERELYAAHSCPEMGMGRCRDLAGKGVRRFKAGDVHHLRLDQRSRGGALFDFFSDKTLPRYRVTCGNLVPPESP